MAFEVYILPDSSTDPKMPVHTFVAIIHEYIAGQKSKVESLAAIEARLGVALTNDEKSDLQALMTAIDGESTTSDKKALADTLYRVLILAEDGVYYTTKALLKARLSWV